MYLMYIGCTALYGFLPPKCMPGASAASYWSLGGLLTAAVAANCFVACYLMAFGCRPLQLQMLALWGPGFIVWCLSELHCQQCKGPALRVLLWLRATLAHQHCYLPPLCRKYFIDIVDAKPSNAISVIETDCEVDFAPPLDYVEPNREATAQAAPAAAGGCTWSCVLLPGCFSVLEAGEHAADAGQPMQSQAAGLCNKPEMLELPTWSELLLP